VCRGLVGKKGAQKEQGILIFFYEKGNENHKLGKGFFVLHRIVLAVNRV
jgi:hypothetical protein